MSRVVDHTCQNLESMFQWLCRITDRCGQKQPYPKIGEKTRRYETDFQSAIDERCALPHELLDDLDEDLDDASDSDRPDTELQKQE